MRTRRGMTLLEALCICLVVFTLGSILVPNFVRARAQGRMSGCPSNLKNIAAALEMYAADNGGLFPLSIPGPLTPNYLPVLPTCPVARSVTYVQGYRSSSNPNAYFLHCHGGVHAQRGGGYPQYDSASGLRQ